MITVIFKVKIGLIPLYDIGTVTSIHIVYSPMRISQQWKKGRIVGQM